MNNPERRGPSLSRRLTLGACLWIGLGLGISGAFLSYAFEQSARRAFDDNLTALMRAVVAEIEILPNGTPRMTGPLGEVRFEQVYSGWYWQVEQEEDVLLRSRSLWDTILPDAAPRRPGKVKFGTAAGPRGQALRTVATIFAEPQRQRPLTVTVAITTEAYEEELRRFDRLLILSLGILGLGLATATILHITLGLRPLRQVIAELRNIRGGSLSALSKNHPREITPLVEAFNEVRRHDLETLEKARKEIANLAHGLKTPLARLSMAANELGADTSGRLAPDIDEIRRYVDFHLARAATSGAYGASARKVPIRPIVQDIASGLHRVYADKGITAELSVGGAISVLGEEQDVTEVLGNLFDNAFKWAKSKVRVTADESSSTHTRIIVEDDGPGMTAKEAEAALERGRRLDDSVPGSGLGLSIVADIMRTYGGDMDFDRSELGGLRVAVSFRSLQSEVS